MSSVKKKAAGNWGILSAAIFGAITLVFVLISGESVILQIHDNLDSVIPLYKMMKDSHLYWTFGSSAPMLGGIDRNYLSSDLSLYAWLHMLFPAFSAIVIGWYIKIAIAVAGFIFLGRTVFSDGDRNIFAVCGLIYGILPTFPTTPFGFASIPVLLAVLIRIYRKADMRLYPALLAYPLLSNFSVFGIFICAYIALFFIIDWIVSKKPAWRLVGALAAISAGFVIAEWRLFYVMFFTHEETIRSTFSTQYTPAGTAVRLFVNSLIRWDYSAATYFVIPVCALYLIYLNYGYIRRKEHGMLRDPFNMAAAWQLLNSFIYAVCNMRWFQEILGAVIPPLKGLELNRTVWFSPFVWYFMLMIILCRLPWKNVFKVLVLLAAFIAVCMFPATYNHIRYNVESTAAKIKGGETDLPSYEEFYAEDLFARIREDIGYDGEWSIAYGMHPAILNYNGIATLDGYYSFYPAEYKMQFRKLIAPELEIDPDNRDYFDSWGGRAYVFSPDCESKKYYSIAADEADMLIDPAVFKEMGGKYVFSAVKIRNAEELGLYETGVYGGGSEYTIYVYSVS